MLALTYQGSKNVRVENVPDPVLKNPTDAIVRVTSACICGSDLSTIDGASSRYFEPIVSFPFTPGHEVVGDVVGGVGMRALLARLPIRGVGTPLIDGADVAVADPDGGLAVYDLAYGQRRWRSDAVPEQGVCERERSRRYWRDEPKPPHDLAGPPESVDNSPADEGLPAY